MYSVKTNVLELTALMKQHGITRAVLSPGSRNSPLNHTLASCPDILCTPVTDERSAAFTANGLCQALRRPVAACCTSGTALLDMAPAVAEAYYQNLPLLIISADRPASAIGQMDGQTIVQPGSFHNYIRKEVTLPEPHDAESLWYCNRLINEALAELTHNGFGPVHINVPITEPLFDMSAPALPEVRSFVREQSRMAFLTPDMRNEWRKAKRVMIICGQSLPAPALEKSLRRAAGKGHAVIVCEHLANLSASMGEKGFIGTSDLVLAAPRTDDILAPDFIITAAGHVVSKRLKQYLRRVRPAAHWHVSPDGACPDLFRCLTRAVEADPAELIGLLADEPADRSPAFQDAWQKAGSAAAQRVADFRLTEFTDLFVMRRFLKALPDGSALQLANSSPVRNAQYFPLPPDTEVCCNRGVNGIDGSLSTATGFALGSPRMTYALIGDLSFFYDQNALWKKSLPSNLRILLFNNGGGGIFHVLPGLDSEHRDLYIAGSIYMMQTGHAAQIDFRMQRFELGALDIEHGIFAAVKRLLQLMIDVDADQIFPADASPAHGQLQRFLRHQLGLERVILKAFQQGHIVQPVDRFVRHRLLIDVGLFEIGCHCNFLCAHVRHRRFCVRGIRAELDGKRLCAVQRMVRRKTDIGRIRQHVIGIQHRLDAAERGLALFAAARLEKQCQLRFRFRRPLAK